MNDKATNPASETPPTLKQEIQQTKPLPLTTEVYLNLLRTSEAMAAAPNAMLRQAGLSQSQYNVLRILRGAVTGLPCREIVARMVTRDSDMTRLLDGLETKGLVVRARSNRDRRVIVAEISAAGGQLLADLEAPMDDVHRAQLVHMSREQLEALSALLEAARANCES